MITGKCLVLDVPQEAIERARQALEKLVAAEMEGGSIVYRPGVPDTIVFDINADAKAWRILAEHLDA